MNYYPVGTPVCYEYNSYGDHIPGIGVIVEVNKEYDNPYRIRFSDDDDDWFNDENGTVTQMVEDYREILNER